nr:unnamed protein product [Digitaria exilis]
MFSLFYGLWNHVFSKSEFHVLILGVHKAGKTTLLEKLKSIFLKEDGLPHDRIVPTVGLNIGRIEDANVKLVFWDLGGQRKLSAMKICKERRYSYLQTSRIHQQLSRRKSWLGIYILKS